MLEQIRSAPQVEPVATATRAEAKEAVETEKNTTYRPRATTTTGTSPMQSDLPQVPQFPTTRVKREAEVGIGELARQQELQRPAASNEAPSTPRVYRRPVPSTPASPTSMPSCARAADWVVEGEGPAKRWKPRVEIGGIFDEVLDWLEKEVKDSGDEYPGEISGIEVRDYVDWNQKEPEDDEFVLAVTAGEWNEPEVSEAERAKFRKKELGKLAEFDIYEAVEVDRRGKRIFKSKWVDTQHKSRLTVCDLKRFGYKGEITSSPTPSSTTISVFEYHVAVNNYPSVDFDVGSAFLHALEENEEVYMDPPEEWFAEDETRRGRIWWMKRSLYGRQTAGRDFREFFEAVLMNMPGAGFTQSEADVCMYYSPVFDLALIHHVDDGRLGGPMNAINETVKYLCEYILLEVSTAITAGDAVDFLKRTKVRTELGWVTLPNHTLRLRILEGLGYSGEKAKTLKTAPTPGVRRNLTDEDMQKDWRPDSLFRSIGGCGTYLSSDVPNILFASKEIARKFHDPRVGDWHALARLGRYLADKGDFGYVNEVTKIGKAKVRLEVYEDASFCGDENSRSTTGITIEATGFELMRVSQTQPGLPALFSGERVS